MPLMNDLDAGVRQQLPAGVMPQAVAKFGGDFEAWLSYLALNQPWLSAAENLRNQAAFLDVSRAVEKVLTAAEAWVTAESMPSWLGQLVQYWERTTATVITFNYDLLVEYAYLHTHPDAVSVNDLYRMPLTLANSRPGGAILGSEPHEAFDLLKLHGSRNWHYSGLGDAPSNDAVFLENTPDRWRRDPDETIETDIDLLFEESREPTYLVDKVPMIVPPASSKSSYYNNLGLRTQWAVAAAALAKAEELVVIGYSLPRTDELVRSLLLTNTTQQLERVISVDPSPATKDHLTEMFGQARTIGTYAGVDGALVNYVKAFCGP